MNKSTKIIALTALAIAVTAPSFAEARDKHHDKNHNRYERSDRYDRTDSRNMSYNDRRDDRRSYDDRRAYYGDRTKMKNYDNDATNMDYRGSFTDPTSNNRLAEIQHR